MYCLAFLIIALHCQIYASLKQAEERAEAKVDLLLICGDFQVRSSQWPAVLCFIACAGNTESSRLAMFSCTRQIPSTWRLPQVSLSAVNPESQIELKIGGITQVKPLRLS